MQHADEFDSPGDTAAIAEKPDAINMKNSSSLMEKTKRVALEVREVARDTVKAVVHAAQVELNPQKLKARIHSASANRPKASKSKATVKRRTRAAKTARGATATR